MFGCQSSESGPLSRRLHRRSHKTSRSCSTLDDLDARVGCRSKASPNNIAGPEIYAPVLPKDRYCQNNVVGGREGDVEGDEA